MSNSRKKFDDLQEVEKKDIFQKSQQDPSEGNPMILPKQEDQIFL